MNIGIIGTGYVGLVTGACFAESGNSVICMDIDRDRIAALREGKVPIYEPKLEELVLRNLNVRLSFTTDLSAAVEASKIIFIAVGTPQGANGTANVEYVLAAAKNIAQAMSGYRIIVNKSTAPVGTADQIDSLVERTTPHPFAVMSNPEFLKEGGAVDDFMKPDRVVFGGDDPEAIAILKQLYEPFVRTGNPIVVMDRRSAEMSKYAANAMLATKISFINEIANLCEDLGADVDHVRHAIGLDRRIGPHFIFPGIGYGGSCFPKDVRAIIAMGNSQSEMALLKAVDQINERQKTILLDKVQAHFDGNLSMRTLAVWGLSFKPSTDDMRESPSIPVIESLLRSGASIRAFDPAAGKEASKFFNGTIRCCHHSYEPLEGADALMILTEWNEFRLPDFQRIKRLLKNPVIFDGRNIFNPQEMKKLGFTYYSIGRPNR
jgi:UDPglucose 6-dehydrogenase